MTRLRAALSPVRLARPMARRPLAFVIVGLLVSLVGGLGLLRFSVDAGTQLLVGKSSEARQVNDRFTATYGADPIVVVIHADPDHPASFFLENNILRLVRLEGDLQSDPNVQTVLGPGTAITSAQEAVGAEIANTETGFRDFVTETALLQLLRQKGQSSPGVFDLSKLTQDDINKASQTGQQDLQLLELTIAKATQQAEDARSAFDTATHLDSTRILDAREQAADQAAQKVDLPPLFTEYVYGSINLPDAQRAAAQQQAHLVISQFGAAFGQCSSQIQTLLGRSSGTSCQTFILRLFLDLPACPTQRAVATAKAAAVQLFCTAKRQWAPLLPVASAGADSYEVLSVRMRAGAAGDRNAVDEVTQRIRNELDNGLPHDSNAEVRNLGPLGPTQKGCLSTDTTCAGDARFDYTVAGAPLLAAGLVDTTQHLFLVLVPIAGLLMLLLLLGLFRVRGWYWPLLAAAGAAVLTVGLALALGTTVTPAVLAGVPVLVGLGVDYAVQLIARLAEERRAGLGVEAALRVVLSRSGPATLVAAVATVAGLLGLLIVTGIDFHFLVAIPLVAQFAVVLIVGVTLSWLAAVFVALPAAALVERRRDLREGAPQPVVERAQRPPARRTIALARAWVAVLAVAAVPALAGWALLPRVPVETDIERLLAHDLPQLRDVDTVRAQIGSANEIDLFIEGDPNAVTSNDALAYQLQLARTALCQRRDAVVSATTLADLLGTGQRSASAVADPCTTPPTGPAATPSPSASATPSATASPSALRIRDGADANGDVAVLAANSSPSAALPTATPAPAATPAPGTTQTPTQFPLQSANLCLVRLFGILSHSLVDGITLPGAAASGGHTPTAACPPPSLYGAPNTAISQDPTPVTVTNTRIPMGVRVTSVADQAALLDALANQIATTPMPAGVTGAHPAGLVSEAAAAYRTLTSRALVVNLVPVLIVALTLLLLHTSQVRRALLPVLPTVLAAGWGPLLVLLMGRLPGNAGAVLGSLTPLTVVLGALVVALATEFGVVLLERFYEERRKGLAPDEAAAAAVGAVGRSVLVSAATLAAGFGVLALSAFLPNSLPVVSGFGFTVVLDLGLAVLAVFGVMLPLAVAMEHNRPLVYGVEAGSLAFVRLDAVAGTAPKLPKAERRHARRGRPRPAAVGTAAGDGASDDDDIELLEEPAAAASAAGGRPADARGRSRPRMPGVSARPRARAADAAPASPPDAGPAPPPVRLPGLSGRRRPAIAPAAASAAIVVPPAVPAGEPSSRRPPGGVVPRHRAGGRSADPPPTPVAPPLDPVTVPAAGAAPRGRRRRPPPHLRKRGGGPPPLAPA